MSNTKGRLRRLTTITAAVLHRGLRAAPAAIADPVERRDADRRDGRRPRSRGVQQTHAYTCDENRPEVQAIVQGVKDS